MPQTISPWDILTSSGRYKDRIDHEECTTEVRVKAADLAERVSRLLDILNHRAPVSSGFRTKSANGAASGAKVSAHLTGEAVDLADPDGSLGAAITRDPSLLDTCDLYMENPYYTIKRYPDGRVVRWIHLQSRRTTSGRRIFVP